MISKTDKKLISKLFSSLEEINVLMSGFAEIYREKLDERSERWKESENGEAAEEEVSYLEEASEALSQLIDTLGNIELE